MNQEPRVMETNSLFEVWRIHLGKLARDWKVTAGAGDSQGERPDRVREKRLLPQSNTPLPLRTQAKAIPDGFSRLTSISWTRIYS